MSKYNKYIFDVENKKFLGNFEEMYINEYKYDYDSWNQNKLTYQRNIITLAVLKQYNFSSILDIGCGKGAFTHLFKRKNNSVLGIDISETAIKKAQVRYLEVDFKIFKAEDILSLNQKFDLVIATELLSYVEDWRDVIYKSSKISKYLFVSLFLPPEPIGFVKSFKELSEEVEKHFKIVTKIISEIDNIVFILAIRKKPSSEGGEVGSRNQ